MESALLKPYELLRSGLSRDAGRVEFPFGLGARGVHEVCEAGHGDFSALTGFALTAAETKPSSVLWVSEHGKRLDHGGLRQGAAARMLRTKPAMLHVAVRKTPDALWAAEEGVRSGAASLVVAELSDADFTATRRLTLASARYGTPVILLMPYAREGATASEARWRVAPRASGPNRFDRQAPGNVRWRAVLERSRSAPQETGRAFDLEYDDETLSLSVVSGLAARPAAPRAPDRQIRLAG